MADIFELHAGTWLKPRLMLDIVQALPAQERRTVGLYYYAGWDAELIAQTLGLKTETVWGLHCEARRHMRQALGIAPPQPGPGKPRTTGLTDEAVRQMRPLACSRRARGRFVSS